EKPNVLLITVDTTRADHLPVYGYKGVKTPNLDALAKRGVLFRECATAAPLTLPSHCSIMTGTYPTYHGVRVNGNTALSMEQLTLAEEFAANGYETGAFVGAFVLDGRWGLNQGFQHYDDQFDLAKFKKLDLGMVQRPANEVVDAALKWLDIGKGKPFFAWLHLYDPHTPYAPPEPYRSEYGSRGMVGLYDGEIAFMDEQIGRCLAWLDQNDLRKRTIIVVVGDHGEGLGEHGEMTHGYFIYDYAVHVPFILSVPVEQLNGREISSQVRTIDLYPTLLSASGIKIPRQVQGVPLWPIIDGADAGERLFAYSESMTPSIQYGWSALLGLRTEKYKYIDAPRPELFNLENDPGEQNDIHGIESRVAGEYQKKLKDVVATTGANAPAPSHADLDNETLERLAALGYIGAPVTTKPGATAKELVDPKDRLAVHEAISRAGELNNDDQYAQSAQLLEGVLRDDPANPQARLLLSANYIELKRPEEAKALLNSLLQEDPQNIRALVTLAGILQDEGKSDEVIHFCRSALDVDQRNTRALALMGRAYMDMHNFKDAMPWLQKAVEVQPKLTQNLLNLAACQIGLKDYTGAGRTLNSILAEHPKFPLAHYHLGLLNEGLSKIPEAVSEYQKEIELYGDCFVARFNLGRLQLRLGDHASYMTQMREVVRIAPKNAAGYLFLARGLLQENASPDQILALAQQGLSLAHTAEYKAMGYFMLADVYTRKHEPQQVRLALAKANEYKAQITK
ncbi:MAG TPA: sulfatase-like hydrolase/transferase, partial [Acidobacteriota bacterium]|nr:sulfatase-like hydrolase/transferase [Acidobacteriota bacterium]